jgi:translocation and assembly module TamB
MAAEDTTRGNEQQETVTPLPPKRRMVFTRRNALLAVGVVGVLGILIALLSFVAYRNGVLDTYVKTQFTNKMADIGIVFSADVFRVNINPLELELQNATFNDKVSGEKLFFIRNAHLAMTVQDLYSWQLSRDISIDNTDISGADVWITFDKDGNSNFSNLHFVENEQRERVNFKYQSMNFSLKEAVIHYGDVSRSLAGDAKNIVFTMSPLDATAPDEQKRYNFDFVSTDSDFAYEQNRFEKIDIRAVGIADKGGAEIHEFTLRSPLAETTASGMLLDWANIRYDLNVTSTVDLTQAATILPNGTQVVGVGNFKGRIQGQGEQYRIEGTADSESLRAAGVYLKAVNVNATVAGVNNTYEANGTAVAEMMTFEDFKLDFIKLYGNVRGTGSDFRWVGDLQAAAVASKAMTFGGLFLKDAVAEHKDRDLYAEAASGRAATFDIAKTRFESLAANGIKLSNSGDTTRFSAPAAQAAKYKVQGMTFGGLSGRNLQIVDVPAKTDVDMNSLRAQTADIGGAKASNVSADRFHLTNYPVPTDLVFGNLRIQEILKDGTRISGIDAPELTIHGVPAETQIYADKLRIAKLDTGSAMLGSLNVGGVRLTVRQGVVEGRTNDIDAGNVALAKTKQLPEGGSIEGVRIAKPVFVLEPSGRYRASADMSIGGGAIGSVALGAATAQVAIDNSKVAFNNLTAQVMNGQLTGTAVVAFNDRTQSTLRGSFTNVDLGKLLELEAGRVVPVTGQTTGTVDMTFDGTNFRNANGTLNADIVANAGNAADQSLIPINGQVRLAATNGLFNVETAHLDTAASHFNATGRFDLQSSKSDLTVALNSSDASEVERLVRVLDISPDLNRQLDDMQVQAAGNLAFNGTITGNFSDPNVNGHASLASLTLHGRDAGAVTTDLNVSSAGTQLANGKLTQADGGTATFAINIPAGGTNNTSVQATLTNINAGSLLAALPITLPERLRDFDGRTSGTVDIRGLPNNAQGGVNLTAASGTIAGQAFDNLAVRASFAGTNISIQQADMLIGAGRLGLTGNYDRASDAFDLNLTGNALPMPLVLAFLPKDASLPYISGTVDVTAKASGIGSQTSTYNINFNGIAHGVNVNENAFGDVTFNGDTANQMLNANLTATLGGQQQVVNATLNFANEDIPFRVATDFNNSPLAPFFTFVPALKDYPITGVATGHVEFGGNLSKLDDHGARVYSSENLQGTANFTQLNLQLGDTPLNSAGNVELAFNTQQIVFNHAQFSGGGSNMTIAGTKALTATGTNDLAIDGRVNLSLLNLVSKDAFFSGLADTAMRISGPNATARLVGSANIINGGVSAFVGTDRFTANRIQAKLIFTTNQVEIEQATGYLGGGQFNATGGATLSGLDLQAFRLGIDGTNVTVPLPRDFVTTGDAQLEITGSRPAWTRLSPNDPTRLVVRVGGRVLARRSIYSKDIDLSNLLSSRREVTLASSSSGTMLPVRFDLTIEGRDALIVRNNIADLTASVSLQVTGDADNPQIAGRITANSGTIFFRKDRYEVQRATVDFPPGTELDPIVNLQAETEIAGYQVFVNLNGPLRETEDLNATVRSNPALPQADVVSLITTGNLTNSAGGIPTLAQGGINTAAEVLTDAIINNPVRKATDKLFGLNVFEIDPLIAGQTTSATARLTVGRQINNNLRVTYSTNLSQDQNQVLAFEYRVSNKLSFVARYEQRPLANITRNRDNFSFEVRFKKRF